jgi:CRISPR-associated endonuclease Cas1
MNARFLEKLILYRQNYCIEFCKTILKQKIKNQFSVVGGRKYSTKFLDEIEKENQIQNLLLIEARAAKFYWKFFREKIKLDYNFKTRDYKNKDIVNQLLNIGYHYLVSRLEKTFIELEIPTEIGFFHKAQTKKSKPLIYDHMEWLRPMIVDKNIIIFLNKKKKPVISLSQKDISKFLSKIKKGFEINYYHKKLTYCLNLDYFTKLVLLNFIESVNKESFFKPTFPSLRHENRCRNKKTA